MNIYSVFVLLGFVAFAFVAVVNFLNWILFGISPFGSDTQSEHETESQRQNRVMLARSQEANATRYALDAEATRRCNTGENCYPIPDLDALKPEYKSLPSNDDTPRLNAPRVRRAGYLPDPDVVEPDWIRDL